MSKPLILSAFIIFFLLNLNPVSSSNYTVSCPSYFSEGNPQIISVNVTDIEADFEGALTVFLEVNGTDYGLIFDENEWKDFLKYPILMEGQSDSGIYSDIIFKANSLPENFTGGFLKIVMKNENGSETEIYNNNVTIFKEIDGSYLEFFYETGNRSFIEIRDVSGIRHRYNPEQHEKKNTKNDIYYKFPLFGGSDIIVFYFCHGIILNSSFNVSNNETVRIGNIFDMKIESIIDEKIFPKIKYDNIFKITNNDHRTGERENIEVLVSYSVRDLNSGGMQYFNFTKDGINSYSSTGTGELTLDKGEYEICGDIESIKSNDLKAVDPFLENNIACRNITVKFDKINASCNPSIYLNLEPKYREKKNDILITIVNFSEGEYLIKIISKNIFSNNSEEKYFLASENETIFEIDFPDYAIFDVSAEILESSCSNTNLSDNSISKQTAVIEDEDFGIETYTENMTYEIGDILYFPVFIYNGLSVVNELEIETSIKRYMGDEWEEIDILNLTTITLERFDYSWSFYEFPVGNESISGYYKIQARAEINGTFRYSYSYFNINGIPDMGEENLSILINPDSLRFGDIESVLIDFYSGNRHDIEPVFVVYINKFIDEDKTKYAAVDFDLSSLQSKIYESMASVKMKIERGKHYFIALPLFVNPNCDDNYRQGYYRGVVRAYLSENRNKYESIDFVIELKEGSGKLCPKSSSKSSAPASVILEVPEQVKKDIKYPGIVHPGEEFEVEVDLKNTNSFKQTVEIYSYVYEGSKLLSYGLSEDGWGKAWTSNKITAEIPQGSGKTVKLKNMIKEETAPGKYNLRVRKLINGKKEDIDGEITVVEKEEEELENQDFGNETDKKPDIKALDEINNQSHLNLKEEPEYNGIPTGAIVGRQFDVKIINIIIVLLRLFI
ncbi:MAG: hypothetical protein JW716_03310 [Candidatus Aenigmarchaeota archaeon]|nr:hypothetical protein [Candidatus Aenigmarchaeota archaeon]